MVISVNDNKHDTINLKLAINGEIFDMYSDSSYQLLNLVIQIDSATLYYHVVVSLTFTG